jgi:papain fold toxin 1 (glutamine deamidase) of polymorphic toxin system
MDPYEFNSVHCVQAFELRRRGMDVEATGLPAEFHPGAGGAGGRPLADIERAWGVRFTADAPDRIGKVFEEYGPGARGFVAVAWRFGGGHVFSVENADGRVRFVDPQTGEDGVGHYLDAAGWAAYARVDGATPGSGILEFAAQAPGTPW